MRKEKQWELNRLRQSIENSRKEIVTEQEVLEMMENQVFSDPDYKRQVIETAKTLNLPEDKVAEVIRHHFTVMAIQMTIVTKVRRRLSIYAFCMIEILDRASKKLYHPVEYYEKQFGKKITKELFSIFKF